MKEPTITRVNPDVLNEFVRGAATVLADRVPTGVRPGRKSSKHPAVGYKRTTMDVKEALHEALAREALETKRDRREILEQLLEDHFNQPEFQKYTTYFMFICFYVHMLT